MNNYEKIKNMNINEMAKYWCSLNNKLCGYVEVYDCNYEEKENDK